MAKFEIDSGKLKRWLKEANSREGRAEEDQEIKLNHVILKMIAGAMKSCPRQYGKIVWGKFVPFEDVDISMLVDINGKDLAFSLVRKCDKLGI